TIHGQTRGASASRNPRRPLWYNEIYSRKPPSSGAPCPGAAFPPYRSFPSPMDIRQNTFPFRVLLSSAYPKNVRPYPHVHSTRKIAWAHGGREWWYNRDSPP